MADQPTGKQRLNTDRRHFLRTGSALVAVPLATIVNSGCSSEQDGSVTQREQTPESVSDEKANLIPDGNRMHIEYLEMVTPDIEAACALYSRLHKVTFSSPDPAVGNARTARLPNGTLFGIRAPMHASEKPVLRPYVLVKDIEAAVSEAEAAGAMIALPPMKLENHGTCAIFFLGGIEHGLWQAAGAD